MKLCSTVVQDWLLRWYKRSVFGKLTIARHETGSEATSMPSKTRSRPVSLTRCYVFRLRGARVQRRCVQLSTDTTSSTRDARAGVALAGKEDANKSTILKCGAVSSFGRPSPGETSAKTGPRMCQLQCACSGVCSFNSTLQLISIANMPIFCAPGACCVD